jgi:hypothetical protein
MDFNRGEDAKDDAAEEDDIRLVSRRNSTWQAIGPGRPRVAPLTGPHHSRSMKKGNGTSPRGCSHAVSEYAHMNMMPRTDHVKGQPDDVQCSQCHRIYPSRLVQCTPY